MAYAPIKMPPKPKYTYTDGSGSQYCVSTETGDQNRPSMESLRYTIEDGGDHSRCKEKTLSVAPWPAEMVR